MQYLVKPIVVIILAMSLLAGCLRNDADNSKVVANVYGKKLHLSELDDIFPINLTKEDSLQLIKGYCNKENFSDNIRNRDNKSKNKTKKIKGTIERESIITCLIDH